MRRSRLDIALGRRLEIGQQWRDRTDGSVWRIRQVHRGDCHADAIDTATGKRALLTFTDLRLDFDQLVPADHATAA
jgi:hypothetical protein